MTDAEFEEAKIEIRSLLISFQKGTSLSEFKKEYKNLIGRELPSRHFNFKDDISFLNSMPDAVAIRSSPVPGDYHLIAIADKSVKHIQKMVCKQKPSKRRTTYRMPRAQPASYAFRSRQTGYVMPPRFVKKELPAGVDHHVIRMLEHFPAGLKLSHFLEQFCSFYKRQFTFKDWGFSTLEECLETIPGLNAQTRNNEILVHLTKYALPKERKQTTSDRPPLLPIPSNKNGHSLKSISSYQTANAPLSTEADYFDRNFYKNEFVEDSYGQNQNSQSSAKASVLEPELLKVPAESAIKTSRSQASPKTSSSNNFLLDRFVEDSYHQNKNSHGSAKASVWEPELLEGRAPESMPVAQLQATNNKSRADTLDNFELIDYREETQSKAEASTDLTFQECHSFANKDVDTLDSFTLPSTNISTPSVSENIKRNLRKVIENCPHGIFAIEFKSCYERVTQTPFDLHSLGFNYLSEFIDAVPDVLIRKPMSGSKKDWIIYPAKAEYIDAGDIDSGKCSLLFIECVILNTRKILQAYSEGIKLSEFIHVYSINCNEPLYIVDLGFDNLENFLLSIAQRVPLRIASDCDHKVVHLDKFEEMIKPPIAPSKANVPFDVAPPAAKFEDLKLPANFDYSMYVPVYTSSIANPGLLYIQLQGEETGEALKILYDRMEAFYNGELSNKYKMKHEDIKVDKVCAALWPVDKLWYRAKIISITSLDFVQVFYVDYGTTEEIPLNMLRYIKEDYMKLPAQAVKSRLAYMRPPNQSVSWDKRTRRRMLELCQDKSLMAKIENIKNGVLSIILCDTSGADDLYINDILTSEGFAELCAENEEQQQNTSSDIQTQDLQNIVNYLANAVQTTPDNLARVVQSLSVNPKPNMVAPGFAPQSVMSSVTPGFMPFIQEPVNNIFSSYPFSTAASSCTNVIPPPVCPYGTSGPFNELYPSGSEISASKDIKSAKSPLIEPSGRPSSPDDFDVFDEDEDELFEELCKQFAMGNTGGKKRFVKRIKTTDGYVFHILIFDAKPFVASGDISVLIWNSKSPSQLFHRLQIQEVELPSVTLVEDGNEEFFQQLERFSVKGIQKCADNKSSILIYPLENVNQILNLFGHPSAALRAKINTELVTFNASSPHWQDYPDSETPEEIEEIRSVTDDDKLNRLCLYDLKTMKEGIRYKRLKMIKSQAGSNEDEINKLNQLFTKVRERILEIEQICKMFSDSNK